MDITYQSTASGRLTRDEQAISDEPTVVRLWASSFITAHRDSSLNFEGSPNISRTASPEFLDHDEIEMHYVRNRTLGHGLCRQRAGTSTVCGRAGGGKFDEHPTMCSPLTTPCTRETRPWGGAVRRLTPPAKPRPCCSA
eukprot:3231460-Pleurochrysis_carterae.AAC.1